MLAWCCGTNTALDLEPGKNRSDFLPGELEFVAPDEIVRIAEFELVATFVAVFELVFSTPPRFVRTSDLELEATVPDCFSCEYTT